MPWQPDGAAKSGLVAGREAARAVTGLGLVDFCSVLLRRFLPGPLDGVEHDLGGGFEMELFLDAVPEGVDGGDRDLEVLGDLAGAFALA